jgi:hypothetical protein
MVAVLYVPNLMVQCTSLNMLVNVLVNVTETSCTVIQLQNSECPTDKTISRRSNHMNRVFIEPKISVRDPPDRISIYVNSVHISIHRTYPRSLLGSRNG